MIRTNSYNTEPVINPLPYIAPPPPPRDSFSKRLMKSSYLFPKSMSNPRMMSNNSMNMNSSGNVYNNGSSLAQVDDDRAPASINRNEIPYNNMKGASTSSSRNDDLLLHTLSTTSNSNNNAKKAVRFHGTPTIHRLQNVPLASAMSSSEKSAMWYDATEYDAFKFDAAEHAGVKIARCDANNDKKGKKNAAGCHFYMVGNFDERIDDNNSDGGRSCDGSSGSAAAFDGKESSKAYYNQNEYNDCHDNNKSEGGTAGDDDNNIAICKRGLGYHFSRSRKKSRLVTRSAVVAWQKTLGSDATEMSNGKTASSTATSTTALGKNDRRTSMMLALISTKCSRVAREEAKWRGDVDYRVAYPERMGRDSVSASSGSKKRSCSGGSFGYTDDSACDSTSAASASSDPDGSSCKRQRRNGCREDQLSPRTIGYLVSGVLRAEV